MSFEHCDNPADRPDGERPAKLAEARALLVAALDILDRHARSPAAAQVDLALYNIDRELSE